MSRVFIKIISSASHLEFETNSNQIFYTTRMYDAKQCGHIMQTVSIDEEEWRAIVEYGEEAGFSNG